MSDKTPEIPLTESSSTAIIGHGYDAANRVLALKFNGGRLYRYADVPAEVYEELKAAKSLGRFFGSRINGKFKQVP